MENFNLDVTVKIDWNSIEIRKRNWNAETVLKALTGDIFSNKLGGLDDVLQECVDMKTDIECMFNEETVVIAMGTAVDLKEITIAFEDKRPTFNEFLAQKSLILKDKCIWCFALENGCLLYNRETFPLWRNLFFYRGVCASMCSAAHSLSIIHPERSISRPLIGRAKNLTLDVEWKSFGLKELSMVRSLITEPISREVQGIAYDCLGMLRLCHKSEHIVIKNSPSQQHSGIAFLGNTVVISIHPSMNSKRQWQVERSNADVRLAEVEDRQLTNEWDVRSLESARKCIRNVEKEIEENTGLSIKINIDEKRIILSSLPKLRREMTHPNTLIISATEKAIYCIKDIYIDFMTSLLRSPRFSSCRKLKAIEHNSGIWVKPSRARHEFEGLVEGIRYTAVPSLLPSKCAKFSGPWILDGLSYSLSSDQQTRKISEASFRKTIGSWEFRKTSDAVKKPSFVSFENSLYAVDHIQVLASHLEKVPQKVTFAHDVTEIIELNGISSLKDRFQPPLLPLFPSSYACIAAAHMKQQIKERLVKLIPVSGIEFDEESFVSDTIDQQRLSQCAECILSTVHELVFPEKLCSAKQHRQETLFRILSRIKTLKIEQDKEPGTTNTSSERTLNFPKSSLLSKITVDRKKRMTIVFSNKPFNSTFIGEFKTAIVQFVELLLEELLPTKPPAKQTVRVSSGTMPSLRRHYVDVNSVVRPAFDDTIDAFSEICDMYLKLTKLVPSVRTVTATKVTNVCLSSVDGDKLRVALVGEILLLYIPSFMRSTEEFPSMLLSTLGVSDDQIQNALPVFQIHMPHIFFPDADHGTAVLRFYNIVNGSGHRMSLDHYKLQESFTVSIKRGVKLSLEQVKITNVELRSSQEIAIKWRLEDKSLGHESSMKISYLGHEIENAAVPLLPRNLYKARRVNRGNTKGSLTVLKTGHFPILLMHQKFGGIEVNRDAMTSTGSQSSKLQVRIRDVDFVIRVKRKSFPSVIPNNPIDVRKHPQSGSNMIYRVEVLDSNRWAAITAVCRCCGQFLSIATPEWLLQPGEALYVNFKEEL